VVDSGFMVDQVVYSAPKQPRSPDQPRSFAAGRTVAALRTTGLTGTASTLERPGAERRRVYGDGPIEYSHTLTEQIGGQLAAGFILTHLVEAPHQADATARYLPGYFATRAVKPPASYSP
jgi:hypothetical protein